MDAILASLNEFRQSTWFPACQHVAVLAVLSALAAATVVTDDLLREIRTALRRADIAEGSAAIDMGISKGLMSRKLSGDRPVTVQALADLPVEFWQWFAVGLAERVGVPATVTAGARLARRQARMSLTHKKVGAA